MLRSMLGLIRLWPSFKVRCVKDVDLPCKLKIDSLSIGYNLSQTSFIRWFYWDAPGGVKSTDLMGIPWA